MRNIISTALIVTAAILLVLLMFFSQQSEKEHSVSSLSSSSSGLSIFLEISKRLKGAEVLLIKHPLLTKETLEGKDLLLFLSPRSSISEREATLISDFVTTGGHLILSFHDKETESALKELYKVFKITASTKEDESFKNGQSIQTNSTEMNALAPQNSQISFYSNLPFAESKCPNLQFECYEKEFNFGKGRIILISGLPPFSNALISRDDNRSIAFRLIHSYHSILIDEYRHFYSEKTFWDLLLEPSFFFPIFGLLVMALLFFLFGRISVEELSEGVPYRKPARPYHAFNERVLSGLVDQTKTKSDLLYGHAQFLRNLFPNEQSSIEDLIKELKTSTWLEGAKSLALLHKKILENRRGIS